MNLGGKKIKQTMQDYERKNKQLSTYILLYVIHQDLRSAAVMIVLHSIVQHVCHKFVQLQEKMQEW